MTNDDTKKWWHSPETATKYDEYAKNFPIYQDTSQILVNLANIKEGAKIVDLACGTGITTNEILKHLNNTGHIYAVDISEAMLNEARKNIQSSNVTFIQSDGEELDKVISESVDLVICNSAFWFLKDRIKGLNAIHKILKDGGKFLFSAGPQFFKITEPENDRVHLQEIMLKVAKRDYGFTPSESPKGKKLLTIEQIKDELQQTNLKYISHEIHELEKAPEDRYAFQKIPIVTERSFPDLTYDQRMDVLEKAYAEFEKVPGKNNWVFIVVEK